MNSIFHNRHFITADDWSKNDLDTVFEVSFDLKKRFALGEPHRLLQDKTLFMIFFEQSTRTRNSMEAGMTQLGAHAPNEKVPIDDLVKASAFYALYALNMK